MAPLYLRVYVWLCARAEGGKIATSYGSIADGVAWKDGERDVVPSRSTVCNIVKTLAEEDMIIAESLYRRGTRITICNYTETIDPVPVAVVQQKDSEPTPDLTHLPLTKKEYARLHDLFPNHNVPLALEAAESWHREKGKKPKSPYRAMLNWLKREAPAPATAQPWDGVSPPRN